MIPNISSPRNSLRKVIKDQIKLGILPKELISEYIEYTKKFLEVQNTYIAWYPWMEYRLEDSKGTNITKEQFYELLGETKVTIKCDNGSIETILVVSPVCTRLESIFKDLKIQYRYKNGYICAPEVGTGYTIRVLETFKKHLDLDIEIIRI